MVICKFQKHSVFRLQQAEERMKIEEQFDKLQLQEQMGSHFSNWTSHPRIDLDLHVHVDEEDSLFQVAFTTVQIQYTLIYSLHPALQCFSKRGFSNRKTVWVFWHLRIDRCQDRKALWINLPWILDKGKRNRSQISVCTTLQWNFAMKGLAWLLPLFFSVSHPEFKSEQRIFDYLTPPLP